MLVLRKTPKSPSLLQQINRFLTTQASSIHDKPSSAQYDDLINAAGRQKDFTTVHHLLNKRMKDGLFNTSKTFSFITTGTDLSILTDLLQTLARVDEGFSRKSAYDSLIARLCKLQRTDEALRVVNQMIHAGHGANAVTFHPILVALSKKKKLDEAKHVIDLMRQHEIAPDIHVYNLVLTSYCFIGNLASAAGVLTWVEEAGLEADNKTYDALVLGACRSGKVEGAFPILRRMVDLGLPILYATAAHVIDALCRLGYSAQAVEFVMAYEGRQEGLDSENFGLLCSRLIKYNKLDEAEFIVKEMKNRGLPIDRRLKDFYDLRRGLSK